MTSTVFLLVAAFGLALSSVYTVSAASANLQPTAKISFTFDDGLTSALTKAAPALAESGYVGTDYVVTNCVGTTGSCPADPDVSYMTWDQIKSLKNTYGWEIGSHSVTHPELTQVSATKLQNELVNSRQALTNQGLAPTSFALPYGDYNNKVIAGVAKYYSTMRPFHDQGQNVWPYNDYLLYVKQVQMGVTVAQVKSYINEAKANNAWLVLVFHEIRDTPSTNPEDYQYGTGDLKQIAAYAKSVGLAGTTVSAGTVSSDVNLLPNPTFANGISDGWTTDAPTFIKQDTATNGSFPSPQQSIALTSTNKSVHLFSPKVAVDSTKTYAFKTFLNISAINSGEVTYYIDEYNASDQWISGQYKLGVRGATVKSVNLTYKPSSANVRKASFQVAVSPNSGIKAFLDNVQMFPTN